MDRSASIRLGSYQFSERLGEGGSGQVWRAVGPDGPVAVKVLSPAGELDDAARARFKREIAALGQLRHPHLVPLLDHGIDPELGPYLVLPLLPGQNLRDVVAGRALCPEAAILLALPIARAAAALHGAGYVHRDLKPENAIAAPDGALTVIDLGLAWREGMTRHTDTGAAVGSVGYMAPEQIEGRAVTAAADVWALGVMMFEWVAGKRPFARGRPSEEAAAALIGACPKLTAADRRSDDALADLVARCLAADPAARPSATDVVTALAAMVDFARGGESAETAERAAVIADPAGYQARIAPLRIRRLERLAREALDAGRPFAALALCDRGLAYAPDHVGLAALVTEVEVATAIAPGAAPNAPGTVQVTTGGRPAVNAVVTTVPPKRHLAWWIGGGVVGAAFLALIVVLAIPRGRSRSETAASAENTKEGLAVAKDFLGLFDRAMTNVERKEAGMRVEPALGPVPTTAGGWLDRAEKEEPGVAVVSVRQALALQPGWQRARDKLCRLLVTLEDPEADVVCVDRARCVAAGECAAKPGR